MNRNNTRREFSAFKIEEMMVRVEGASAAQSIGCVGTAEEALTVRTVKKVCGGVVVEKKTKQTGEGEVKITAHVNYDTFCDIFGMNRDDLKEGAKAFGSATLPKMLATLKILDENDNPKLKAYPNCVVASGPTRKADPTVEEIPEFELTLSLSADEYKECMYEQTYDEEDEEDRAFAEQWMSNFEHKLVEKSTEQLNRGKGEQDGKTNVE